MRTSQLRKKVAQLAAELTRLFDDLPNPVYGAMTNEELFRFEELHLEQVRQGISVSVGLEGNPEAVALWKTASARIEKRLKGKGTWPHWRSLWTDGVQGYRPKTPGGKSPRG